MDVTPGDAAGGSAEHAGVTYWFCSPQCRERFVAEPRRYTAPAAPPPSGPAAAPVDERVYTCPMHPEIRQKGPGFCPKCGMALEPEVAAADEGRGGRSSCARGRPSSTAVQSEHVHPDRSR